MHHSMLTVSSRTFVWVTLPIVSTVHSNWEDHVCPSALKTITIPRLELSAAALAVKLNRMIQVELDMVIDKTVFWTDSTSVLKFINNTSRRFHTFVANRLSIIHDGSTPNQWKYVESKLNPADSATRGLTAKEFIGNKQ